MPRGVLPSRELRDPAPRIAGSIADVRAAALAGDTDAAAELTARLARDDGYESMVWTDPFVPVAMVSWTPDGEVDAASYRRLGDFTTGRVEAEWMSADGEHSTIALVPDRVTGGMSIELRSDRDQAGALSVEFGKDARGVGDFPSTDYGVFIEPAAAVVDGSRLVLDVRVDERALPAFVREHPPSPWPAKHARLTVEFVFSGTPELFTSYLRAIFRHVDDYAANAERIFGAPGWVLPARFDSHGKSNHFATDYPHLYWMAGGAWVLRMAWDQFSATGDVDTLREYAWPLAQNVMAVAELGDDGALHLAPSYSPENTPGNRTNPIAVDATMDVAAFRDAARIATRIADVLGEDADRDAWRALADGLPPYRVADDGTFAEWLDPTIGEQLAHRHVSQLYPFWYEDDAAAATPELRAAALETIARKLEWRDEKPWGGRDGRMEMAFGLVGLGLAAARLGDDEAALQCVESLARDFWRANAVSTHDGDAIFNVDASGGLPAIVIEMLVQSQPGHLSLLPALPASWPSGSIRGVRARGGILVDELTWDTTGATATLSAVQHSAAARDGDVVTVTGPDGTPTRVDLSAGPVTIRLESPHTVTLDDDEMAR